MHASTVTGGDGDGDGGGTVPPAVHKLPRIDDLVAGRRWLVHPTDGTVWPRVPAYERKLAAAREDAALAGAHAGVVSPVPRASQLATVGSRGKPFAISSHVIEVSSDSPPSQVSQARGKAHRHRQGHAGAGIGPSPASTTGASGGREGGNSTPCPG